MKRLITVIGLTLAIIACVFFAFAQGADDNLYLSGVDATSGKPRLSLHKLSDISSGAIPTYTPTGVLYAAPSTGVVKVDLPELTYDETGKQLHIQGGIGIGTGTGQTLTLDSGNAFVFSSDDTSSTPSAVKIVGTKYGQDGDIYPVDFIARSAAGETFRLARIIPILSNATSKIGSVYILTTDIFGAEQTAMAITAASTNIPGLLIANNTTQGGAMFYGPSGAQSTALMGNGEILIGTNSTTPVKANLTAGSGISITNGSGTITIASSRGTVFSQTASVTVSNTVTETTLVGAGAGSMTLANNDFGTIGDTYRLHAAGRFSVENAASRLVTFRVKAGSTVLYTTNTMSMGQNLSNRRWVFDADIVCRTTGGSGTLMTDGYAILANDATSLSNSGILGDPNTAAVSVALDTSFALSLTAEMSHASTSNIVICQDLQLTRVR